MPAVRISIKPRGIVALEKKYPSINFAYQIAIDSYAWSEKRFNAVDEGIEKLLVWSTTVTSGVVTALVGTHATVKFSSGLFMVSMCCFFISTVLGLMTKFLVGDLVLLSPRVLHDDKWLMLSDVEFKERMVFWAGEHFEHNRKVVNTKGRNATICAGFVVAEFILMITWIITSAWAVSPS